MNLGMHRIWGSCVGKKDPVQSFEPGRVMLGVATAQFRLERWLRVRGVERLVIVGVSTNHSVEASARTAGQLGFGVQVVADATFAFARPDHAGTPRSAEDVHLMALANLHGEYATVVATAALLTTLTA